MALETHDYSDKEHVMIKETFSILMRRVSKAPSLYRGALTLMMSIAIWSSSAAAETTGIFGPTQYTRQAGPPQTFMAMFDQCGTAACRLIITNGNAEGKNRISSASILLNGEEIVSPRDFNKQVSEIIRPVAPGEHNDLVIRLASGPGGFLTVEVRCAESPVELFIQGNGVDLLDSNTLLSALRIGNFGMADAENVEVGSLMLTDGTLVSPASLPYGLGTIPTDGAATLNANFSGTFAPLGIHLVEIEGTYEAAGATFCFALDTDLQIPPAAPGSATLGTADVPPQTVTDAPFPPQPPQFDQEVNQPFWSVPIAPLVPGTPTDTTTTIMPPPDK